MSSRIAIVGGGPAGMVAAAYAGSKGDKVTLFEKNEKLGKKLYITGKGRCNITNYSPIESFFDNIMTNSDFLYSAFYSFTNTDILNLLERYGLKFKVERGNRVFPKTDKSSDVIRTFERILKDNNVEIFLKSKVINIEKEKNNFIVLLKNNQRFSFDKVVIATGGISYPFTGSTGDGYKFAKKFGHTIKKLKPALVPIELSDSWINALQGLSLRNISLCAQIDDKVIHEEFGEMLFTHYGISGPIVLSLSNKLNKYPSNKIKLFIDLKPALSREKLEKRILKDFKKYSNKQINNGLKDLLPQKIIPVILKLSHISEIKPIHQITIEERSSLVKSIKKMPLTFSKFRPIAEAIVTSGGVSTDEIIPSTMESKFIKGLFFAGEIIDVDALTGGYNLQITYSTGYLAGTNV